MKFDIKVRGSDGYAVYIEQADIGLNGVDQIRSDLGLPELGLTLIDGMSASHYETPVITIPERMARDSGLFEKVNRVEVTIPQHALNRYAYLATSKEQAKNGEIERAWLSWLVDYDRLLEDWAAAGYPVDWQVTESEADDNPF